MSHSRSSLWIVLTALVSICPAVFAQTMTFRSTASVVLVPAWVRDGNRLVRGLSAADFQVLDNGVAQEISMTTAEAQPVDVTLVLDTSGSVSGANLDALKTGVGEIVQSLGQEDRVRLLTFATGVVDAFGLRQGGAALPLARVEAGGSTSLYDAVASALMSTQRGERVQLIFTMSDGLDTESFIDADQLVPLAAASGAALYVALVQPTRNLIIKPVRELWAVEQLRDATAVTGGLLYENPAGGALPTLFSRALQDFRTSYLLSYTPRGVSAGGRHEIVVRTKDPRYTVRAKRQY